MQDHEFSLSRLATGHSPFASVRYDPVTPSSILLAPLVSSPCTNANGGNPLVIGSSDWLTLLADATDESDVGGGTGRALGDGGILDNR